jgi:hypothetical protein
MSLQPEVVGASRRFGTWSKKQIGIIEGPRRFYLSGLNR